jgi:LacI family transcriptional regulator
MRIPYVFFDSDLPGAKPICTIMQDSFRGGYLAGSLLHLFIGAVTGSVAVFYTSLSYHITRRKDGFLHYASEKGIKVMEKNMIKNDYKIISKSEIAEFLSKQQSLQGIFVPYVDIHHFAQAAEARRNREKFCLIGYDLVPINYKLLKEGRIDAIISQRPQEQGRLALQSLFRYIVLRYAVDSVIETPLDIYIKGNVPEINDVSSQPSNMTQVAKNSIEKTIKSVNNKA